MIKELIKKVRFIVLIGLLITLCGCRIDINDKYGDGKVPENDFTITDYITSNMVLQQNLDFEVNGTSEEGVVLTATLFDELNDMVSQSVALAGVEGKFVLKIKACEGNNKKYRLEISDSKHTHKYHDIMFGEVWMFAGEHKKLDFDDEASNANHNNIRFVKYHEGKLNWYKYEEASDINVNAIKFSEYLNDKLNIPVAVIDATADEIYADAWISEDIATNYNTISKYLNSIGRDLSDSTEINHELGDISSMYNAYIKGMEGFAISGILWHQGKTDFKHWTEQTKTSFVNSYSYLLIQMFNELNHEFNNNIDIFTIQDPSYIGNCTYSLRDAQSAPSYQIINIHLIATYNCYEKRELENKTDVDEAVEAKYSYKFSPEMYADQIHKSIYEVKYNNNMQYESPSFTDVLIKNNNIQITFNYNYKINIVDELNGFSVIDSEGNEIEYTFSILDNTLTINLILKEEQINSGINCIVQYGHIQETYKCNLSTINGIPVVPFKIIINE